MALSGELRKMLNLINFLRPYIEILYFLSGISLAITALVALKQLGIMKHETNIRTLREARIMASEIVGYFKSSVIPSYNSFISDIVKTSKEIYKMESITFKSMQTNERQKIKKYIESFNVEENTKITNILEQIEKQIINLTNGIADSDFAFDKIGIEYCVVISSLAPFLESKTDRTYSLSKSLFDSWNSKIIANKLENELKATMKKLQTIEVHDITLIQ